MIYVTYALIVIVALFGIWWVTLHQDNLSKSQQAAIQARLPQRLLPTEAREWLKQTLWGYDMQIKAARSPERRANLLRERVILEMFQQATENSASDFSSESDRLSRPTPTSFSGSLTPMGLTGDWPLQSPSMNQAPDDMPAEETPTGLDRAPSSTDTKRGKRESKL